MKCQSNRNVFKGLRICVASAWYPHADNPYYCIFVHEFAKRLRRSGAKVFVLTVVYSRKDKRLEIREGVPIVRSILTQRHIL